MATLVSTGSLTLTDVNDSPGILLTKVAELVATAADGSGGVYGFSVTASVMLGSTNDSDAWTFTATPLNLTGAASNLNKTYTVSGMTADTGYVSFLATRPNYPTLTQIYTVSKAKAGAAGPALQLTASRQNFLATDGTLNSGQADITLTAVKNNTLETVTWTSSPSLVTGTGNSKILSAATFGTNTQCVITITTPSGLTDVLTVLRLEKSTAEAGATDNSTSIGGIPVSTVASWNANGTTKMNGAEILTGSILAEKLGARTITALSGVIGDLAVDTLQIADQAVTIPVSAYTEAGITIGTTNTVLQTVTYLSSGSPVNLRIGCYLDVGTANTGVTGVYFRGTLTRNGVVVLNDIPVTGCMVATNTPSGTSMSLDYVDTNANGSTQYVFSLRRSAGSAGTVNARRSIMSILELKK